MVYKEYFIKEPIGWKLRNIVYKFLKKINYILTYEKRMELYKKKGLKVGKNVHIDANAKIDENFCHLISIGDNCRICRGAVILAHDGAIKPFTGGYGVAGKVEIKDNCIISINSIILPGVTIGPNVMVGAGSVVNKDIPPDSCVIGVPARYYGSFSDFIQNFKDRAKDKDKIFKQIQSIRDYELYEKEMERMKKEAEKDIVLYEPISPRIISVDEDMDE